MEPVTPTPLAPSAQAAKFADQLARVTSQPGVYLMRNRRGRVIYVGKALNLKKRLTSYFKEQGQADFKTAALVSNIKAFETVITRTEKEALILESNLIKLHRPRYNIELKDDKRYPSLRLDLTHPYPNLAIVRKIRKDGARYFGPYSSAKAVRQTLRVIHRTFKLRKCHSKAFQNRSRPCLYYQMGLCHAPCCLDVSHTIYDQVVNEVILFLKGRTPQLIQQIKKEMLLAAEAQEFERAAVLRDKMFALQKTLEKQVAVTTDFVDRDVLGMSREGAYTVLTVLFIRGGFWLGTRHFEFENTLSTDPEIISSFILQYYEKDHTIPKELLITAELEELPLLEEWLWEIKGTKVHILHPQRGKKRYLVNMATENARNHLQELLAVKTADADLLARLQERLRLADLPTRIECFDNSNISGTNPVASMVVFEKGRPKSAAYRRFRIKNVPEQDDYAYMAEVLSRRFKKTGAENKGAENKGAENNGAKNKELEKKGSEKKEQGFENYPDLLMVDGGKGQLNIALAVLQEQGLAKTFAVVGIAKKDERRFETEDKIFKPGRANPINFGRDHDLLLFLQRIRDEAHRFAITYHRKRRSKTALTSKLDGIPGIGPQRKKILLKHFGSIKKIGAASVEEVAALPGLNMAVAEAVTKALAEGQGSHASQQSPEKISP